MKINKRKKILIVDDELSIRELLSELMHKHNHQVIAAENGMEAVKLYQLTHPDIVITDIKMPKLDGISLLKQLKSIDNNVLIILISSFGNEEILLEALRAGAVNFIRKPFKIEEITDTVENILAHKAQIESGSLPFHSVIDEKKEYVIVTEKAHLGYLINQITVNFKNIFSDEEIINLRLGIEEMIANAIEHGNLAIGFSKKSEALKKGNFGSLLEQKLKNSENSQKQIFISSHLTKKSFSITIRDQGSGFDWKNLPSLSAQSLHHYNGRGIILTKIFFDRVIYNDAGNQVTLKKYT
ncbi:MAG: response regulator [Spirochaetales bacterium]|nr:response regulator [Spirochaetales bacterium]